MYKNVYTNIIYTYIIYIYNYACSYIYICTYVCTISPNFRIREKGVKMLRPVFLYVLCNPSSDSMDYCMQQIWQLLIKSRHGTYVQTEVLLWMCTAEIHSCINTNYRILELAEKAASEGNREYCTALLPMIVSLVIQLLQQGSDPTPNFHAILFIIDHCDSYIGNLVLTLMAEVITLCPAIYLYTTLQICKYFPVFSTIYKNFRLLPIFRNMLVMINLSHYRYDDSKENVLQ